MSVLAKTICWKNNRENLKGILEKNIFLVGYDSSQVRLSGKFSHDPRDQRVLQFNAVFRELDPEDRTYVGTSSGS